MKLVVAVIQPHKLDDVREALLSIGVKGVTVCEARGIGRQKGHTELYRGAEYHVDFVPKLRVEVAVNDDVLNATLEALENAARTGRIGDGKIFVLDLQQAIRIRTGENGPAAL